MQTSQTTEQNQDPAVSPAGLLVLRTEAGSPADRLGIAPGCRLVAINGHALGDVIDLWYYGSSERVRLEWHNEAGEHQVSVIRKAFHERLGVEVEPFEIKRCTNFCVFCFVHQLPRGMRRELYVKDEDYRLSFLYGNYITGTNLSREDKQRIVKMKLSPIYMSVHATDEAVREQLLVKKNIEPIMPLMRWFTSRGIYLHAQIVLCPGINDGAVLERTCDDLATLFPMLESVAIVPLGLTAHRERLPNLQEVTPKYVREFLPECARIQKRLVDKIGFPLVFPSDEFFLMIDRKPPTYSEYPEIPQLANGVGMVFRFYQNLNALRKELPKELPEPRRIAAITTTLGEKVLRRLVEVLNQAVSNLRVDLLVTKNTLFGDGITVSGLLPGADFRRTIDENPGYDRYLIPRNSLRPWDLRFLDDMLFSELRDHAPAEVVAGGETAESFVSAALEPVNLAA